MSGRVSSSRREIHLPLQRFTLSHDGANGGNGAGGWKLVHDTTGRVVRVFGTKREATRRGELSRAIGPRGGSVRIEKLHGGYEEERTFPRSADPTRSKG